VPARPLLLRFRAGAGRVPRHQAWSIGGLSHLPTKVRQGKATAFGQRDLSGTDSAYVSVDCILLEVRLAGDKVRLLLTIGIVAALPKAAHKDGKAAKITNGLTVLLAFSDFPGVHRIHLCTANPIESTFSTIQPRQRVN
jgi:transposase-like protein